MMPPVTAQGDAPRVRRLIERCPIGGIVLFNGQWPGVTRTLTALQVHSPYPLLVGTDMERGVGQQVDGATTFPHARAFGALGEEAEAAVESFARVAAREARACGIHLAFAPVADVNVNPANPIIATRAFGDDSETTRQLVRTFVQTCRDEGLLTTAKHFPGHGRTATDSHAELPVVDTSRSELEHVDFEPFRAAIGAGVESMMTAHVAYPALDPKRRPATLSAPILRDLLRDELGFGGVIISDSLLMEGVDTPEDPAMQGAALLQAGVDVLLDPADPEALADGLVQAVEDGHLSETHIEEAFRRVWRLKEQWKEHFGAGAFEAPASVEGQERVGSAPHNQQAEAVARKAVTVRHADPGALPLTVEADETLMVVRVTTQELGDEEASPLGTAAHAVWPQAQYEEVGANTSTERLEHLRQRADEADHLVLALAVEPAAWRSFGLTPAQETFVRDLTERHAAIIAALGSPHVLDDVPQARALLCTFSDVPASQQALMWVLAGGEG